MILVSDGTSRKGGGGGKRKEGRPPNILLLINNNLHLPPFRIKTRLPRTTFEQFLVTPIVEQFAQ